MQKGFNEWEISHCSGSEPIADINLTDVAKGIE